MYICFYFISFNKMFVFVENIHITIKCKFILFLYAFHCCVNCCNMYIWLTDFVLEEKQVKNTIRRVWEILSRWHHPPTTHRLLLLALLEHFIPALRNPVFLTDYLMDSMDMGEHIQTILNFEHSYSVWHVRVLTVMIIYFLIHNLCVIILGIMVLWIILMMLSQKSGY